MIADGQFFCRRHPRWRDIQSEPLSDFGFLPSLWAPPIIQDSLVVFVTVNGVIILAVDSFEVWLSGQDIQTLGKTLMHFTRGCKK